jgi:hypothetical protein
MNKNSLFGIHSLIGNFPFYDTDLIYYFEWKVKNKYPWNHGNHGYFGTINSFQAKMMLDYYDDEIEIIEQTYLCTGLEQNQYNDSKFNENAKG